MVAKGLKKGDIFVDGGRKYQVVSVNADGSYVSTTDIKEKESKSEKATSGEKKAKPEKVVSGDGKEEKE